jgi:acyl-CoA thioesterase 11/acyl-coenzyme A thioesterase 9
VVTLSFDRVDLIYPIHHQDLIRLEGQLAAVGNSSMMVRVQCFRRDPAEREFRPIQHSYVTMVAIDSEGRSNPNIPGLRYETEEEAALHREALAFKERSREWQHMQETAVHAGTLRAEEVEEPLNGEKNTRIAPGETEIMVRRQFLPRNLNQLGAIFGGDILLWMDRVATYAAREFTANPHMVTIAMNRIFFRHPIYTTDLVELSAHVVYVRHYTLEVEIEVRLQRLSGETLQSHTGYFTVLNQDRMGTKSPVTTGLRLSDDDQQGLHRYKQARERHQFWRSRVAPGA